MDTNETEANAKSEDGNFVKQSRKITSNEPKQHPSLRPQRKISSIMTASEVFRDVVQRKISRDRGAGRKISSGVNPMLRSLSEENKTCSKMSRQMPNVENTYKLEPDRTFPYCKVREIIADTLQRHLDGMEYDYRQSPHKAKFISDDIKSKVKALDIERYRIICMVHIGCDKGQEVRVVSRALWNPHVDSFATSEFRCRDLFAVGTVYGVYFE
eukprot:Seg7206.1 transcript_id=Seg7206.1/GoldUCD/mRNA.D3Y31 product="Tctex1 domain-containing protein 1" protein_id=Seg7206.1/GoldUCD/D3Y31